MGAATVESEQSSRPHSAEVLLTEFRALRAEHDLRIGKQQEITQFALGLSGVVVALFGALLTNGGDMADARGLFPIISILLSALLLMVLDHEMNIAHIQIYIQRHASRAIGEAVDPQAYADRSPLRWNSERAALQQHPGLASTPFTIGLASAKYWTTFLPNVLLLAAYVATSPGHANPWYGWLGFAAAVIIALFTVAASGYTSRLYLKMPHDEPSCNGSCSG